MNFTTWSFWENLRMCLYVPFVTTLPSDFKIQSRFKLFLGNPQFHGQRGCWASPEPGPRQMLLRSLCLILTK